MRSALARWWCASALIAGCAGNPAETDAGRYVDDDDASAPFDAGRPVRRDAAPLPTPNDAGRADTDGNRDFATAVELTGPTSGAIANADDRDYLRFEGQAGQWIAIRGEFMGESPGTFVVLDSAGAVVAVPTADNNGCAGPAGEGAEALARLPVDGTYFVEVGIETREGRPAADLPPVDWTFTKVDPASTGRSAVESESGTSPVPAVGAGCLLGEFDGNDPSDTFALTGPRTIALLMYPASRHGSTGTAREMVLRDSSGVVRLHAQAVPPFSTGIFAVAPAGTYSLELIGPSARGANDEYIALSVDFASRILHEEASEAANGTVAGAELFTPEPTGSERSSLIARTAAGDVDHFAFDVAEPSSLTVRCVGRGIGSSVRGLELALLDPAGAVLRLSMESTAEPASLQESLTTTGRYRLRLRATSTDPLIADATVLCSVYVDPNEVEVEPPPPQR